MSGHNEETYTYRAPLTKVICRRCRRSIHKCVCGGRMRENAVEVRVFEENDVREAFDMLNVGEPLLALEKLRGLLEDKDKEKKPVRRRV